MLKLASLLLMGLLFVGCSTQKGDRGIATSIIRYDYGENIFRVLPTEASKVWVTLVRDKVKSDGCNGVYFASAPEIEQRYATERVIPSVQPRPIRRTCAEATVTEDGRTIPGSCGPLTQAVSLKPAHTETVTFGYKLNIGPMYITERGCTGPSAFQITYQTVVSSPIELEMTPKMGLTIGVPEGIDRIEVSTIAPKVVSGSATHVINLKK